jgi:hypothetical protein
VEPDEHLQAQGVYQQSRQGRATALREYWSVHDLQDGTTIWRSHLLAEAEIPLSACYMLRNPLGAPMQLGFYWRWPDSRDDYIEYRFMPDHLVIFYRRQMQTMILPTGCEVYGWHTLTEHALWAGYDRARGGIQEIALLAPGVHQGTLWPSVLHVHLTPAGSQIIAGLNGPQAGRRFMVDMPDVGLQQLYFDQFGVPLRWIKMDEHVTVDLVEYARFA